MLEQVTAKWDRQHSGPSALSFLDICDRAREDPILWHDLNQIVKKVMQEPNF